MRVIDRSGQTFNRWTVLSRTSNAPGGQARWLCRCECGGEGVVIGAALSNGQSKSCGCLRVETTIKRSTKHGHATNGISSTYVTWAGMVDRCTNPNNKFFADYGARGISVCEQWKTFTGFLTAMGEKPKGLTLDRIDNELGYGPENCRWATTSQQARNKRNSRWITHNGQTKSLADWADESGVNYATLFGRLKRGEPIEVALSQHSRRE